MRATDSTALPCVYSLPFAACYAYSPKGDSGVSRRSRELCARVKNGDTKWLKSCVASVRQEITRRFCGFFNDHTLLVPVPHTGRPARSSPWVSRNLALVLQEAGMAEEVWPGLRNINSEVKLSSIPTEGRHTVQQHYQSFAVIPLRAPPADIVLVDDFIARGRKLLAAAMRMVPDVARLFAPCEGVIRWDGQDANRVDLRTSTSEGGVRLN
jgi:hypothetical protein